jgi:hypothetical protein
VELLCTRWSYFEVLDMSVTVPVILSLILGWLATLTLQSAQADMSILDFMIATLGAGLAAALAAGRLEIPITGVHGVTIAGVALMYAGALGVLFVANMLRRGRAVHAPRGSRPTL